MSKQSAEDSILIAPGTVVDGRYRVVRRIGQGGNGMVYEVEHARTGRKLALKALLDETGFGRLEQEARAASLMKNGHTARIVDMEPGGPTGAYLVMDLLDGQSLRGLLDDAGQLPLELTVNIAMQVCECLHEAHGLGIIHRDLKPENIFLCPSPWPGQYDVKVLDFGVMKIAAEGGAIPKSSLTRTGSTVGTPYYMSLEQLRNSSAVDARADVYSLGVLLYECLSGRKPFQAETIGDLVYALCSGPPTHVARIRPDVPAEVGEVVMRTLSANRDDRPASMFDLALSLLPYANQAFSLWVRVDGRQPALAPATTAPPASRAGRPPRQAPAHAALKTAVLRAVPDPTPSQPRAPAAMQDEAPDPPRAESRAGGGAAAHREADDANDVGARRDTPTEMYVKGVHLLGTGDDARADGGGSVRSDGDRDTPTRAIELAALAPLQAPPGSPYGGTAQPPGAPVREDAPEAPTMDLRGMRGVMGIPAPTFGAPILQPNAPEAKLTMPLPMTPMMPEARIPSPSSVDEDAFKPAWQRSLDRALAAIGTFVTIAARRFREAPQNTQIIIIIVAATAVIMVLGIVLFLAMH
jgi:serine/threonine-protein kinase